MIYQLVCFLSNEEIKFFKKYAKDCLDNYYIINKIKKQPETKIIYLKNNKIIYDKHNLGYIAFVVNKDENEFFILNLIDKICYYLKTYYGIGNENLIDQNALSILMMIDECILNGKVLDMEESDFMNRLH
ncbi:AP-3 complex subunit sigma-1 [Gurleya vavrai]